MHAPAQIYNVDETGLAYTILYFSFYFVFYIVLVFIVYYLATMT